MNEMQLGRVDPSDITAQYIQATAELNGVAGMPVGCCWRFGRKGLPLDLLRDMIGDMNVGKLAYVIVEWDEHDCFEVQRLPDGSHTKTFYRSINKTKSNVLPTQKIKEVCEAYVNASFDSLPAYDKVTIKMKDSDTIPKSLIQRRLSSARGFADIPNALDDALGELCEAGYLKEVEKGFAKSAFNTFAKLYQIIK